MLQTQATERLADEFGGRVDRSVITAVVSRCVAQLRGQGDPAAALPELLERLARAELVDRLAASTGTQPGSA